MLVQPEQPALQEIQEQLDLKEPQDRKAMLEQLVQLDCKATLVQLDLLVQLDHKAKWVPLDSLDCKAMLAQLDLLVQLA